MKFILFTFTMILVAIRLIELFEWNMVNFPENGSRQVSRFTETLDELFDGPPYLFFAEQQSHHFALTLEGDYTLLRSV